MELSDLDVTRSKLKQVYEFLQALDQRRNVPKRQVTYDWSLRFADLPDDPTIERGSPPGSPAENEGEDEAEKETVDPDATDGEEWRLRVRRPELTECPPPPPVLSGWLNPGWENPDGRIERKKPAPRSENGEAEPELFEDDPSRIQALDEWRAIREVWAARERIARKAMEVFEKLYALKSWLDRDADQVELLVGDGLLDWPLGTDAVRHPILLQRLELRFDPEIPEFTLFDAERAPELYVSLLRDLPKVSAESLSQERADLERGRWHPLGGEETDSFLRRVVAQLAPRGRFVGSDDPRGEESAPCIGRSPVLFLRPRTFGYSAFIDAILQRLPDEETLPDAIRNILGLESLPSEVDHPSEEPEGGNPDGEDESILFCKPANAEQLQVAQRLQKHGAALVQGPPGTGKTHTIANLVGHLLSEGKSVLITSHTTKALQVVHEKIPAPLQSLCVSVLDESRRQMEAAVGGIAERLASSNADELEAEAKALFRRRAELLDQIRQARTALKNARMDEYRPILLEGAEIRPLDAAREVGNGREAHGWIPTPVVAGEPMPLSVGELADLYDANGRVSPDDERQLGTRLPDPARLLSPADFKALVREREALLSFDLEEGADLWSAAPAARNPEELLDLSTELQRSFGLWERAGGWEKDALQAGYSGGAYRAPWEDLIRAFQEAEERAAQSQVALLGMEVSGLEAFRSEEEEAARTAQEMFEHLSEGGHLGLPQLLFRPRWKRLHDDVRVNGHPPKTAQDIKAILALIRLDQARSDLRARWERLVASKGGPSVDALGTEPERVGGQMRPEILKFLDWSLKEWEPLAERIAAQGLQLAAAVDRMPPNLQPYGDLLRLRDAALGPLSSALGARIRRLQFARNDERWRDLQQALNPSGEDRSDSENADDLRAAARNLDPAAYEEAFGRLSNLLQKSSALRRRQELLRKLEAVATGWAAAIRLRQGMHGEAVPPQDAASAWRWRQLNDELERRGRTSLEDLQARIRDMKESLNALTAQIVEKRSWASQARRTTLKQRQALMGFKTTLKAIGKGTGKSAPRLKREAQKLMPDCQSAVPVWIMPLSRVAETFDPRRNRFDVIIIDEASQADIMSLSALYLARQVIVVGDDQQVSPLAVSVPDEVIQGLINAFLPGIPNKHLYDGRASLYAFGEMAFAGAVMLREHFRCVRPIIEFSNQLCYDGKIKPLRDASSVLRRPHTVAHRVEGQASARKANEAEAVEIVSLLRSCLEFPEYDAATFGVISMTGEEQARRIDNLLRDSLSATEYERRRIRCGNPAQFQGDERDVMFLSMVDVNEGEGPLALRREGAGEMFKQRYNVAASRARDQMWVVYSMDPENDLKPDDLRRRLILHAQDPARFVQDLKRLGSETDSEFERLVLERLVRAGYRVIPQWPVGGYRIDLVVEGGGKRLAVECDGDRWHTAENLAQDMDRQAILERLGWRFARLRGSRFFRDPDAAMRPVFERLESLGIAREAADLSMGDRRAEETELHQRVLRRAAEIRRERTESLS
jgi:very-short-patch-repair endonuclease